MKEFGVKNPQADLGQLGLKDVTAYWNLTPEELIEHTISKKMGVLADTGALAVNTGEFTGRSPKDRFIVKDSITAESVDWNDINMPFDADKFDMLKAEMIEFIAGKELYVRDVRACADRKHQLKIRVMTELPWANMFAGNMFLRQTKEQIERAVPEWQVLAVPSFHAKPEVHGTRQHNFAIVNFTQKMIIIGGTAYTGEIKKGIFSVLNFVLPHQAKVLSMHCSANVGRTGDTALFFGLSGTGKTTLSADPERKLIGDDEHGWSDDGVFNFEGGCYAKCIDLSSENEPDIFGAIKHGAILENVGFYDETRNVDFEDVAITQNTRVSYPIHHINNIMTPSYGGIPKNVFFLTYDAFGVLPPIARLDANQAMYQFISGYTSKVAGTEEGIDEPVTAFSACYGAPFLPLHPAEYAEMLGERVEKHDVKIWLVNTGLTGGAYGTGTRMSLKYTRALITAALNGKFDHVRYEKLRTFNLNIPTHCPDVPDEILNPRNAWDDKKAWDETASKLAGEFNKNFEKFASQTSDAILSAAPEVAAKV
ncbi:MAG: phosphoenolpyruvate carboxykinase (ATP) [Bacteroidetes bacterium]|nr:phosphoenolpyruvate carboxykinase (ATP) [Bacteroidota bacterium]